MENTHPLPVSYWVRPLQLLAGHYPGDHEPRVARQKLRALVRAGITYFVDLTDPRDGLEPYEDILHDEAEALGVSAERYAAPVRDVSTPSTIQLRQILEVIDAAIEGGRVVYVHCWGGVGRTGVVVGA